MTVQIVCDSNIKKYYIDYLWSEHRIKYIDVVTRIRKIIEREIEEDRQAQT